jgi:hypothetical protein
MVGADPGGLVVVIAGSKKDRAMFRPGIAALGSDDGGGVIGIFLYRLERTPTYAVVDIELVLKAIGNLSELADNELVIGKLPRIHRPRRHSFAATHVMRHALQEFVLALSLAVSMRPLYFPKERLLALACFSRLLKSGEIASLTAGSTSSGKITP